MIKSWHWHTLMNHSAEIGLQGSPGALEMQGQTRCPRYLLGGVETLGMSLSSISCSALSTLHKPTTFARHVLPPVCSVLSRECASVSGNMQAVDIGGNHVVFLSLTRLHSPCLLPLWLACSGVCNQTCLPSEHAWTVGVPVIASCKLQHRQTNNKQRQKLSLCFWQASHCSLADEELDSLVGTMLSRGQSQFFHADAMLAFALFDSKHRFMRRPCK